MKRKLLSLTTIFIFSLLMLSSLFSLSANASALPERIERFITLFDGQMAVEIYDIRTIQKEYPTRLLTPESMLPQTAAYPLKDIQVLYQLAQTCSGTLPLTPLVTEPLVFTRALCMGNQLPLRWFARSGLIHPGGGTYASRYAEVHPDLFEALQPFMHIQERPQAAQQTLLGRLQTMDAEAMNALISGAIMVGDQSELWLRKGDEYYLFSDTIWQKNARKAGLKFSWVEAGTSCFVQRGNLCWDIEDHTDLLRIGLVILILANISLVASWAFYRWNSKRKEMQSRMLILQILTHELRTPIASLSLTVEGFRREFEHLPESLYDEFRRLCEDSRRLRQLAEASKDYLQSDNKPLASSWVPSVREWLQYKVEEEFQHQIELIIDEDFSAKLNVYWLGTCVDNLIRNAVKYGVAPISLEVTAKRNAMTIKVTDQGHLTKKDWRELRKPFVSKSGLGLGLTIVESMAGRMGGRLTLIGPPTTFILEIPCETDLASC